MSDVIQKPGKYQQFNGKPAEVKWVGEGKALGFDSNGEETLWNAVTGKWHGTAMPDFHFHITGPWIPDPPKPAVDPGEGWRLLGDEEVIEDGDEWGYASDCMVRWNTLGLNVGCKAGKDKQFAYRRRGEPEWTPTNELRWRGTMCHGWPNATCPPVLQQKWTNGTDSEWRPVTVEGA